MSRTPRASVVMPTYNKAPYLERTLASWVQQEARDYEIVLVNDGSTDQTREVIERYQPRLPLVAVHTENRGRAAARNEALRHARGELVVFSDDDRLVHPSFVQAHVEAFEAGEHLVVLGPQRGIATEIRDGQDDLARHDLARILLAHPEWLAPLSRGEPLDTLSAAQIEEDLPGVLEVFAVGEPFHERYLRAALETFGGDLRGCSFGWVLAATGNMSARREAVLRVGGFDEAFQGWGLEDTDLHYRLSVDGAITTFAAQALNYHQNHRRDREREWSCWLRNALRFLDKHRDVHVSAYMVATLVEPDLTFAQRQVLHEELEAVRGSVLFALFDKLLTHFARVVITSSLASRKE
jgi:glycosyltransferase involved in cell wall biosynthesis